MKRIFFMLYALFVYHRMTFLLIHEQFQYYLVGSYKHRILKNRVTFQVCGTHEIVDYGYFSCLNAKNNHTEVNCILMNLHNLSNNFFSRLIFKLNG